MFQTIKSADLLSTLKPNGLYILLYHHPNPSIKYHWGLYHHYSAERGGWKFDIINPGGVWRLAHPYDHGNPRLGLLDPDPSEPLGVAVSIGEVKCREVERVHEVIREEDERLNEIDAELKVGAGSGINCRIYVMRACLRLREAELVRFGEWDNLEQAVLTVGEQSQNVKGRGVVVVDPKVAELDDSR